MSGSIIKELALEGADGQFVPLIQTGRAVSKVDGLVGLNSRERVRPRPGRHGVINNTKYRDSLPVVIEGELWGDEPGDAWIQYDAIATACAAAVDSDRQLRWTQGSELGAVIQEWHNLVPNGHFEEGLSWWSVAGTFTIVEQSSLWASGGNYSIHTAGTAGSYVVSPVIAARLWVSAGSNYVFSFTRKHVSGTSSSYYVNAYDSSHAITAQWLVLTDSAPVEGRFNSAALLMPANTAYVSLFLPYYGAEGEVYVDDVYFGPGVTAPPYFDRYTPDAVIQSDGTVKWIQREAQVTRNLAEQKCRVSSLSAPLLISEDIIRYQLTLRPSDPRSFDQNQTTVIGPFMSAGSGGKIYPYVYPRSYAPTVNSDANFTVAGSDKTPPLFRVYGLAVAPAITLVSTGESISLIGGYTIMAGTYIDIDVAARQVILQDGTVRNDLLDFTTLNWWELSPGPQTVRLVTASNDAATHLEVRYNAAYA